MKLSVLAWIFFLPGETADVSQLSVLRPLPVARKTPAALRHREGPLSLAQLPGIFDVLQEWHVVCHR